VVANPTLNRFYSLHFVLPFVIVGGVMIHLAILHKVGSNNPLGVEDKSLKVPFYPYFFVKDNYFFLIFL
jgi:ubiquinol-cytochrome c reductase cytochrome b subunit